MPINISARDQIGWLFNLLLFHCLPFNGTEAVFRLHTKLIKIGFVLKSDY